MKYYFAPMDGITDYLYRQIVWKHFPYWDKLYAPFIQPNDKPVIVPKEDFEICPLNNKDIPVVPQILTCDSKGFIKVGEILEAYGYKEINLNIGCPAKIIVKKGKGAGMLLDDDALDRFFDDIFSRAWNVNITVKTRLGLTDNMDFADFMRVFVKYPIKELIIHPRFRTDFYTGEPRLAEFEKAQRIISDCSACNMHICYNGNINSIKDLKFIQQKYPYLDSVMLGRGALANPGLIREIRDGEAITLEEFKGFHDDILNAYKEIGFNDKLLLYKLKEMWNYWSNVIACDKEVLKALRLTKTIDEYKFNMDKIYDSWSIKEYFGFTY